MPEEWRNSTLVPLFKNKGDTQVYGNYRVLVAETRKEVSNKLDEWREALEDKGLRISRTKTEYFRWDFSGSSPVGEPEVSIDETIVKSTTKYKYLGSIIQRDVKIDEDVNHRIHEGWLKWRAVRLYTVRSGLV
ncbi:uncharacterized protein LOC130824798 [Amaranthus tricolor]|uniref:uncharacterized protein LOC130824798 n=1 Tax=Amaranthus tricolor TaxID=29722 RepID=UPI00258C8192|nr:uncharacterized protein LOC130824798 [Amaranthus tricolor]